MACVRKFEVPPPETHNNCDAIFKSRAVAMPPGMFADILKVSNVVRRSSVPAGGGSCFRSACARSSS